MTLKRKQFLFEKVTSKNKRNVYISLRKTSCQIIFKVKEILFVPFVFASPPCVLLVIKFASITSLILKHVKFCYLLFYKNFLELMFYSFTTLTETDFTAKYKNYICSG